MIPARICLNELIAKCPKEWAAVKALLNEWSMSAEQFFNGVSGRTNWHEVIDIRGYGLNELSELAEAKYENELIKQFVTLWDSLAASYETATEQDGLCYRIEEVALEDSGTIPFREVISFDIIPVPACLTDSLRSDGKFFVLTEGELDSKYLNAALELLGETHLHSRVDIRAVGQPGKQGPKNSGASGLDNAHKVIEAHPDLVEKPVLLLYDCDVNKPASSCHGKLFIRTIPRNEGNTKVRKGIENLLPSELFEDRFYQKKTTLGDYGEEKIIPEFRKADFCKWICEERRNVNDFQGFQVIVEILRKFVGTSGNQAQAPGTPRQ